MQSYKFKKVSASYKMAAITAAFISFAASICVSSAVNANEPATAPKIDINAGEALYSNGDATRGITACIGCHGPNGQSAVWIFA
jgi:cytochrome c553